MQLSLGEVGARPSLLKPCEPVHVSSRRQADRRVRVAHKRDADVSEANPLQVTDANTYTLADLGASPLFGQRDIRFAAKGQGDLLFVSNLFE